MELTGKVVPRTGFDADFTAALFRLYQGYYAPTDPAVFAHDLHQKSYAITVHDREGRLRGFSTVLRLRLQTGLGAVGVLYSGDTIIDRDFWGEQTLPCTWITEAGRIKAERPDQPLYWLLVTKGHRTYRYLPAFAETFHPGKAADPALVQLTAEVAGRVFGDRYDPARGILVPDPACPTALRPEFAGLDAARQDNPLVQAFLRRNPGHGEGQELVCLCELSVGNLRPRSRRWFAA